MKKPLAALIVTLIVGMLAIVFLFDGEGQRGASGEPGPERPETSPHEPARDGTELLSDAPAGGQKSGIQGERRIDAGGLRLYGDWEAEHILGQVLWPAKSPADASLKVLVLSAKLAPVKLHGTRGMFKKLRADAQAEPDGLLASSRVAADGSFDLPLPSDGSAVWLAIDGRYLYLEEVVGLNLGAGECSLTPVLGGCIVGEILLPTGPHGPQEVSDEIIWMSTDVETRPDPTQASAALASSAWSFRRAGSSTENPSEIEFRALPTNIALMLKATSPVLVDYKQDNITPLPGKELSIEIDLHAGARISGWVLDPEGAPVVDAEVEYSDEFTFGFSSNVAGSDTTDEEGHFQLFGLGTGEGSILAQASGFKGSKPVSIELLGEQHLDNIELYLIRGSTLSGVVTFADGSPAAGALVKVDSDPASIGGMQSLGTGEDNSGEAKSDALGAFVIPGLGEGPFEISAVLDSNLPQMQGVWYVRQSGIKPGQADLQLSLQSTFDLIGHVKTPSGNALTEFELRAEQQSGANNQAAFFRPRISEFTSSEAADLAGQDRRRQSVEHPEGEFRLRSLTHGQWSISIEAAGYAPSLPLMITLPLEAGADHQIIMLEQATLSGRVLSPSGEAVPGAVVTLQLAQSEKIASLLGRRSTPSTTSDEEGLYLLTQLTPGPQDVIATHTEYGQSQPVSIEPIEGQALQGVDLTLSMGGSLLGLVFGKDGLPAVGAQVIIQDSTKLNNVMRRTDENGSFRAEHLTPGKYQVTAIFSNGAAAGDNALASMLENMAFDMVDIVEGQETEVVLGKAPANPVQVSGRVTHAGEGVSGAVLSFLPEEGKGFSDMKIAVAEKDGSYGVELGFPGTYMVTVQVLEGNAGQQQQIEHNETIPSGASFGLDFSLPGARISGRLEDTNGKALASTRVSLSIESGAKTGTLLGGQYAEVLTDSEGRYDFDYLQEGSYSISAGGAAFGGAFGMRSAYGREIQSPIRVGQDEHRADVDFNLGASGDITGSITDSSGKGVKEASVFIRDERGLLLERFSMTTTGANGAFEYLGVAPGTYTVSAHGPKLASRTDVEVRVRSNEKTQVQVSVDVGTVLLIKLVDKTDAPIAGITLSVKNEAGHEMSGMFNLAALFERFDSGFRSDEYRVGPVPPGKYEVFAQTPDGRIYRKKVRVSDRGRAELRHTVTFK